MTHEVECLLYDLQSNEIEDISSIALERTLQKRWNKGSEFVIEAPAGHSLLTSTYVGDGMRNLRKGNRKIVVKEDGDTIFHGRITDVERVGDGTTNKATITASDAWVEFGYDADGRAGRIVRGSTVQPTAGDPFGEYDGNFVNPKFASSVDGQDEISGPDLILQALTNSTGTDVEGGTNPGEGPLPIVFDPDDFELEVPTAIDLRLITKVDWPMMLGDFVSLFINTGVTDLKLTPLAIGEVDDDYAMVRASSASLLGTDRSGTVHFDYWTGSKNAAECRHLEAFGPINNKLYDYLGPRLDQSHWRTNLTPSIASPTLATAIATSRSRYGIFMSIRVFESLGSESDSRPLYRALWNAEQTYRVEPRDMLYIRPVSDSNALFEPPADFDAGDLIAINVGAELGLELAEAQRVYGYDRTWTRENVAKVSQLITSADQG